MDFPLRKASFFPLRLAGVATRDAGVLNKGVLLALRGVERPISREEGVLVAVQDFFKDCKEKENIY